MAGDEGDLGVLYRTLAADTRRIQRLRASIVMLERDVEALQSKGDRIHFCVDFFDLREYLSVGTLIHAGGKGKRRIGEEKVNALLFNFLPTPLVLLPPHYREFLSFIHNLLGEFGGIAGRRQVLLSNLRRSWQREMRDSDGLLAALERAAKRGGRGGERSNTLVELSTRVEKLLTDTERVVQQVAGAVAILERFDFLHRTGRLRGWAELTDSSLIPQPIEDEIFHRVVGVLGAVPHRKMTSNLEDARALGLVRLFNRDRRSKGEELFLVTGVDAMRSAVEYLNETILPRLSERVELRDIEYWTLWFNALSQSKESSGRIPDPAVVQRFQKSLAGPLADVETVGREALQILRRREGKSSLLRREQVEVAIKKIEEVFKEVYEPILDGRLLLAELYRGFEPVYEERELGDALGRLRFLLESLRSPAADFAELESKLRDASKNLDAWTARLSDHADRALGRVGGLAGEFRLALRWESEAIQEPYRHWLDVLNSGDISSVTAAEILAEAASERHESFAGRLVQIHALLVLERSGEALAILEQLSGSDRGRPSIRLAEAVLRIHSRQLDVAEEILADLEANYGDVGIELALARLRLMRYEETREVTLLDAAGFLGELVLIGEGATSSEVRIAAFEIRVRSELLRPPGPRRRERLLKLERELLDSILYLSTDESMMSETARLNHLLNKVEEATKVYGSTNSA